jgi:hypothetical protein
MSKTLKTRSVDLEKTIMAKVKSNEISMKPRWYFVVGSLLAVVGLVGFSIGAVFLTNLTLFLLRRHGPMGQWRLQQLLTSFPLWIPILAIVGIVLGIWMLQKYDFSYKKNFLLVIIGFIISVVLAALVIDQLGLNDTWSHQGPMRRFYQQVEGQNSTLQQGSGQGRGPGQGRFHQVSP